MLTRHLHIKRKKKDVDVWRETVIRLISDWLLVLRNTQFQKCALVSFLFAKHFQSIHKEFNQSSQPSQKHCCLAFSCHSCRGKGLHVRKERSNMFPGIPRFCYNKSHRRKVNDTQYPPIINNDLIQNQSSNSTIWLTVVTDRFLFCSM